MTTLPDFDHKESLPTFFVIGVTAVIAGLSIGGLVDSGTRKMQKADDYFQNRTYSTSLSFFVLQACLNIALLIALSETFTNFISWYQLSISGALFSVLLFLPQRNLVDNALRITNF